METERKEVEKTEKEETVTVVPDADNLSDSQNDDEKNER